MTRGVVRALEVETPRGPRKIGPGNPVFVIAELSGNHNQSLERALQLVAAAAEAGADAVKLQTYTADTLTIDCQRDEFMVKAEAWQGRSLYDLYGEATTPWDWQPRLKAHAERLGLLLFSTPFDATAVDFLEAMDVRLYKVASFEIVDIPLLERIGQTGKPVIMSRGMASVDDIELALRTLERAGCPGVAVLHCVSSYPAKASQMNLATIPDLAQRFGVVAGLSDHSLGIAASVTATALGASVIEKHLTIARADGGPDSGFSLEPDEMTQMVEAIRAAEQAVGHPSYGPEPGEAGNLVFRKSVFVVADVAQGERFTAANVRVIRPGQGLHPKHYRAVLGRVAACDLERGTPLAWAHVAGAPPAGE